MRSNIESHSSGSLLTLDSVQTLNSLFNCTNEAEVLGSYLATKLAQAFEALTIKLPDGDAANAWANVVAKYEPRPLPCWYS